MSGFKVVKHNVAQGVVQNTRYLMTNAEGVTYGEALSFSSGKLTKCAATTVPEIIAVSTQAAEATSVTPIATIDVNPETQFEVTCTGQIAVSAIGSKYTIHTDGLQITTTTTSGVFEVTETDGATLSTVRGYFR